MVKKLFKALLVVSLIVPLQTNTKKKSEIFCKLGVLKCLSVKGNEVIGGNLAVGGTLIVGGVPLNNLVGLAGAIGPAGAMGAVGPAGAAGVPGIPGLGGILGWAQYVQLGSQPATVAAGQPFTYTTAVVTTGGIIQQPAAIYGSYAASGTVFQLVSPGVYEVNYQTNFPTPSGVVLYTSPSLNGTYSPLPYTMIGKASTDAGDQVSGSVIVVTTTANTFISVNAAAGNSSAIGVPPDSSTTNQSATTVSFKRLS